MEEKRIFTTEDLHVVGPRQFRIIQTKAVYRSNNGRMVYKKVGVEFFDTQSAGQMEMSDWFARYRKALFLRVREFCRNRCAWLKTEKELELYACECIDDKAYEHWADFEWVDFEG